MNINDIKVGLRYKSLISDKLFTVVYIDKNDDDYAWSIDENGDLHSGFYDNNCRCEFIDYIEPSPEKIEEVTKLLTRPVVKGLY
jgi:hypothetical protein